MPDLLKDYYDTGYDYDRWFSGTWWSAMNFKATSTYDIDSVKLLIGKRGSPGVVTVSIRASDGSKPTGGDLTSGTIQESGMPNTPTYSWVQCKFTPYTLTTNTNYSIVARAPSGSSNALNSVYWREDSSNGYATGSGTVSTDSGSSWTPIATRDMMFRTYVLGATYDADLLIKKIIETPFDIDGIFIQRYSSNYDSDLLIAKEGLTVNYDHDVTLKAIREKALRIDLAILESNLSVDVDIDMWLKTGFALSYPIDLWLEGRHILPYNMDVRLLPGIPVSYEIDIDLENESDIKLKHYSIGKRKMHFQIYRQPRSDDT